MMSLGARGRTLAGFAAVVVVLVGCGGDGEDAPPDDTSTDDELAPDVDEPADDADTADAADEPPDDAADADEPADDGADDGGAEPITLTNDAEHRVTDPGDVAVHCDGGGELYVQVAAVVTVTGSCQDVDVLGDDATVSVESVGDVDVDGSSNEVTADEIDELDITGNGNTVDVTAIRSIDVEGADNTVTFGDGSPDIDDEGAGNSITAR